jgi:acyl dehydratase
MRTVTVTGLSDLQGSKLGPGPWHEVGQDQINQFARATGDHQWIHVDPARAAAGPFGRTIAHGYLTLSLIPALLGELLQVDGATQAINYGLDKARFPAPAPAGSRVRLTAAVEKVESVPSGFQVILATTIDCDAGPKPVCVAQVLYRFLGPSKPVGNSA